MDEKRVQVSFRIPESVNVKIKEIAQREGVTTTDIFVKALQLFIGEPVPGLCSVCHHQNEPGAVFCQKCGDAISPESTESIKNEMLEIKRRMREMEAKYERALSVGKLIQENKGWIYDETED